MLTEARAAGPLVVPQYINRTVLPRQLGAWATATGYIPFDTVGRGGSTYICTVPHTSGTTTAPGTGAIWATVWAVFAAKGEPSALVGDITVITNGTLSAPPGSPTLNDAHIVGPAPTGAWATHAKEIATWNGSAWTFSGAPGEGWRVWVSDDTFYATYHGGVWVYDFVEALNRPFVANDPLLPSNQDDEIGGTNVAEIFSSYLLKNNVDLGGSAGGYSTLMVTANSVDGVDGAGNFHNAATFVGSAGAASGAYLTHTDPGQIGAVAMYAFAPRLSDQGVLGLQMRRCFVEGVTDQDAHGTTVVEAVLSLVDEDNEPLASNHYYMGGFFASNPLAETYKLLRGFVVEATEGEGGTGVDPTVVFRHGPAFQAIDNPLNTSDGFRWAFGAYEHRTSAPYFGITGFDNVSGPGRVQADVGSQNYPTFSFYDEPHTGIYRSAAGRIAIGLDLSGTPTKSHEFRGDGYYIDNVKVLGPRDTGWVAMTGTPNEGSTYDTASVTLVQLAQRVMAIQAALTTHGIIGA